MQNYADTWYNLHAPDGVGYDEFRIYAGEALSFLFLIICGILLYFRQRMYSYWVNYRKPYSLLKVLVENHKQAKAEEDDPEGANSLKSFEKTFSKFYISETFASEILILFCKPLPYTQSIKISLKQPNYLINSTEMITVHYRLSDFLMAACFLHACYLSNLYKHISPWRTFQGFRTLYVNGMTSNFFLHLRDGLT
jgi:hypothetical protein